MNYRTIECLERAKKAYELETSGAVRYETDEYVLIKDFVFIGYHRSFLIKIPKNNNVKYCMFFFHGSRDLHFDVAMNSTNLQHENFIVVYFQGDNQGVLNLEPPHIHKHHGYVSFGENFFEIRHGTDNFKNDVDYVKMVRNYILEKYDINIFYAVGHSNGGVFLCLAPIFLSGMFKKIISHQGGMGYDEWFNVPFELLKDTDEKTPIHFYTGTLDVHLEPCIQAHKIFTNEGFESSIFIKDGEKHTWNKECEEHIFNYLLGNKTF